jgi:hypothetical protein
MPPLSLNATGVDVAVGVGVAVGGGGAVGTGVLVGVAVAAGTGVAVGELGCDGLEGFLVAVGFFRVGSL